MGEPTIHGKVLIAVASWWPAYVTAAEVARETGLSVHQVAGLLPPMEQEGRVERQRPSRPVRWRACYSSFRDLADAGVLRGFDRG